MARWPDDIDEAVRSDLPEVRARISKEQRLAAQAEAKRRRDLAAIMFMSIGATMASLGAWHQWGWPAALFIAGLAFFINGLLIGIG